MQTETIDKSQQATPSIDEELILLIRVDMVWYDAMPSLVPTHA